MWEGVTNLGKGLISYPIGLSSQVCLWYDLFFPFQPHPLQLSLITFLPKFFIFKYFSFSNLICSLDIFAFGWSEPLVSYSSKWQVLKCKSIKILSPHSPTPYVLHSHQAYLPACVRIVLFPFWQLSAKPAMFPDCLRLKSKSKWPRTIETRKWTRSYHCKTWVIAKGGPSCLLCPDF